MKSFLTMTLVLASFSAFSFEKKATLDLTNVYGNLNAGLYEVSVSFTPKTTLSKSSINTKQVYDDGMVTCTTSAQFEIGEMSTTLINRRAGWTKNIVKKVIATVSKSSEDANCITDLAALAGAQITHTTLNLDAIRLPVAAPLNYDYIVAHLSPFAATLSLNAAIEIENDQLVLDPSNMLDEASVMENNKNNAVLTYFVTANTPGTGLSLANGTTVLE